MGYAKRRKRVEGGRFERRARDFLRDLGRITRSHAYRPIVYGGKVIDVGVGKHARLVRKRKPDDLIGASIFESRALRYLEEEEITPKHYELVPVKGMVIDGQAIQEFFDKPSADQLITFLRSKAKDPRIRWAKDQIELSPKEVLLCKKLMGQNKGITLDKVADAVDELNKHLNYGEPVMGPAYPPNVIVLGKTREGKIRLAIVDV